MAKKLCYNIDFVWYESEQKLYHCRKNKFRSCCGFIPNCKDAVLDLFPPKSYPVLYPGKVLSLRLGYN